MQTKKSQEMTQSENSECSAKSKATIQPWAAMLCFLLGLAAAQLIPFGTAGLPKPSTGDNPTEATARAADTGDALGALNKFQTIDWNKLQPDGMEQAAESLRGNAALRQAALARYRREAAGPAKSNIGQLLTAQVHPDVVAAAKTWAQQEDSAAARADGFNLIGHMPPQPATYLLARHAVEHEQDPVALATAVWALMPVGMPDPVEVKRVVPRLHRLTLHPLAEVRSASIQRLAEWDRARLHFTQDAVRLMGDKHDDVRLAAVGATSIAGLTEDAVKTRFFEMLANPKEQAELRSIVLLQLDRFALTSKEHAAYRAVQHELFGKGKGG